MSTRSDIIAHLSNGKWARIYCHFDGYPEGVGTILLEHYIDQTKIEQLIELGALSSLGGEIGEKHAFDAPRPFGPKSSCTAYGRDRGETGTAACIGNTLNEVWPSRDTWTEFTYVWKDGDWWVGRPHRDGLGGLIKVSQALANRQQEELA